MNKPECKACKFFEIEEDENPVSGWCHRYAPRAGLCDDAGSEGKWADFPLIHSSDWCGEFESALEQKKTAADESRWSEFRNLLSVRVGNCLDSESIDSFAKLDVENPWSLRKMRNFGSTSFHALRDIRRQFPGYPTHWDKERKTS